MNSSQLDLYVYGIILTLGKTLIVSIFIYIMERKSKL